jgi:hypothetical protein
VCRYSRTREENSTCSSTCQRPCTLSRMKALHALHAFLGCLHLLYLLNTRTPCAPAGQHPAYMLQLLFEHMLVELGIVLSGTPAS